MTQYRTAARALERADAAYMQVWSARRLDSDSFIAEAHAYTKQGYVAEGFATLVRMYLLAQPGGIGSEVFGDPENFANIEGLRELDYGKVRVLSVDKFARVYVRFLVSCDNLRDFIAPYIPLLLQNHIVSGRQSINENMFVSMALLMRDGLFDSLMADLSLDEIKTLISIAPSLLEPSLTEQVGVHMTRGGTHDAIIDLFNLVSISELKALLKASERYTLNDTYRHQFLNDVRRAAGIDPKCPVRRQRMFAILGLELIENIAFETVDGLSHSVTAIDFAPILTAMSSVGMDEYSASEWFEQNVEVLESLTSSDGEPAISLWAALV